MKLIKNSFSTGPLGNVQAMLRMYDTVWHDGIEISPRGQPVKNVRNLAIVLNSNLPVLTTFAARRMNLAYARREWLWYLSADKFDDSIEQYATMWKKLKQPDGSFYSNYGQYIFGGEQSQFDFVVGTLMADKDSRRASIVLLDRSHMFADNTDMVCTYSINFCIEADALHMSVMMRSNDVIFGFTNDAFCFWQLHLFVHAVLKQMYPLLVLGSYTHIANSMHVYGRHYDMIRQIMYEGTPGYEHVEVPRPTSDEVQYLIANRGREGDGEYIKWLRQDT